MTDEQDYHELINAHLGGYNRVMGLQFVKATIDEVCAELEITDAHKQPYGLVHGGVHAGIVETLCSVGAALNTFAEGRATVGLENSTSFLRAVRQGKLHGRATPVTKGRRTHVWQAEIRDDDGKLVATGRVRTLCLEPGAAVAGEQPRIESPADV